MLRKPEWSSTRKIRRTNHCGCKAQAGKQLMIYLPFALPDKVPFDIADKCLVIENQ